MHADTLRLPTSCVCSDANLADVADQAMNTWKVSHTAYTVTLMASQGNQLHDY